MRKLANSELNRPTVEEYKQMSKYPLVVVLDNIRSANNVGSVFRSSDAFLVESIHLCGITACPPNRDIQKTAIGATQSVDWKYFKTAADSVNQLKNEGYRVFAIEQCESGKSLKDLEISFAEKIAFIFGNEVSGVEQNIIDLCDGCIEIPQWGTKHSLNISVSVGIILWDYIKQIMHDR